MLVGVRFVQKSQQWLFSTAAYKGTVFPCASYEGQNESRQQALPPKSTRYTVYQYTKKIGVLLNFDSTFPISGQVVKKNALRIFDTSYVNKF